jgi:hypothetical protein
MEKNAIFNLRVNTGASDADINKTTKATEGLTKATKDANKENQSFESRLSSLNDKVKEGDFSMREASKMIKEYQSIALQAGRESPVGREAIMQAAALQDKIGDLRNEVSRLSQDGQAMQGAMAIGQTTLAGYTAFQGITAMLGVENEDLMKTMVKMQAAQSVLLSVEQIRKSLEKESVLRLTLINIQTKAAAVGTVLYAGAQSALTFAIGTATGALKLFRIALIATGVGAIVVAIGMLIANFDTIKKAVSDTVTRFNGLGTTMKNVLSVIFPFIGAIRLVVGALEAMGVIDSAETREMKKNAEERMRSTLQESQTKIKEIEKIQRAQEKERKEFERESDVKIRLLKAEGASKETIFKAEQQIRRETIERNRVERVLLIEKNKLLQGELDIKLELGEITKEQAQKVKKQIHENNVAIAASVNQTKTLKDDMKVANAEFQAGQKQNANANKKATKSKIDNNKKAVDEAAKQLERERLLRDFFIASIEDDDVRSLTALQEKHKRELEELEKKYKGDGELKKQLEAQQLKESADFQEAFEKTQSNKSEEDKKVAAERFLTALQEKHKREREELVKKYGEDTELIKKLEAQQLQESADAKAAFEKTSDEKIAEDKKKAAAKELADQRAGFELKILQLKQNSDEELAAKLELMEFEKEQLLLNEELTANEKLLIEKKYQDDVAAVKKEAAENDKEIQQSIHDAMIEVYEQSINAISSISDMVFSIKMNNLEKGSKEEERAARKQFEINKKLQVAQAIMQGYQAVLAAYASGSAVPIVGTVLGPVYAGLAAVAAAANIGKIKAATFQGGGGGPGPDTPAPPSPNLPPQMNTRDVSQGTNTQQQENTTMVAVLESDITNTQRRISDIEVRTTF